MVPPPYSILSRHPRSRRDRLRRFHARHLVGKHARLGSWDLSRSRLFSNDGCPRDRRQAVVERRQWYPRPRVLQQLAVGIGDCSFRTRFGRDLDGPRYALGRWRRCSCFQHVHDRCCRHCESCLLYSRNIELIITWTLQGVFGFLICIAGFLSIKVTSPISHMISAGTL